MFTKLYSSAVQSQKAVSAYFTSKQILPFGFAEHSSERSYSTEFAGMENLSCSWYMLSLEDKMYAIYIR